MHREHKGKTLKTQRIFLSLLPVAAFWQQQAMTSVAKKDIL
jgi:hypothetical protein